MAKILFGGPQEEKEHNPRHDELVALLKKHNDVYYINTGQEMFWELGVLRMYNAVKDKHPELAKGLLNNKTVRPYDLVIYDFDLFYDLVSLEERINIFEETTADYLKMADSPTVIIAPESIEHDLMPKVLDNGFELVTYPYKNNAVLDLVNSLI